MTDQKTWHTCPTCNRVLNIGDECDTPKCVAAAARADAKGQPTPEPAPPT